MRQNEDDKFKRLEKTRDERFIKYELVIEEIEKELVKQKGENEKLKKDKDAHVEDKNQEFERLKSNEQERFKKLEKIKDEKILKLEGDVK